MGTKTEPHPVITVRIVPGKVMPAQRQVWDRFWRKLIFGAKSSE